MAKILPQHLLLLSGFINEAGPLLMDEKQRRKTAAGRAWTGAALKLGGELMGLADSPGGSAAATGGNTSLSIKDIGFTEGASIMDKSGIKSQYPNFQKQLSISNTHSAFTNPDGRKPISNQPQTERQQRIKKNKVKKKEENTMKGFYRFTKPNNSIEGQQGDYFKPLFSSGIG